MTSPHSPCAPLVDLLDERAALLALADGWLASGHLARRVVQTAYQRWFQLVEDERQALGMPRAWLDSVVEALCAEINSGSLPLRTRDQLVTPAATADATAYSSCGEGPGVGLAHRRSMRHRGGLIYLDGSELAAEAFATACRLSSGLMLDMVLAEKVSVRVDGGGHVRIGPTAITGREDVGSFLTSLLGNQGGIDMAVGHVNGSPGVVVRRAHRVVAVLALDFGGGYVHDVWIVVNPDKLGHWNTR